MNKTKITIKTIIKNPLQAGLLTVFTLFMFAGVGFGTVSIIAPQAANALVQGPGCCDIWWPTPDPINPPGGPIFGGGGGGGGGGGVSPAPSCTLTVTPSSVEEGNPVSISWTTQYAGSAVIDNGIGEVAIPSGTVSHTPTGDTTYTMTVLGFRGERVTCSDSVEVVDPQPQLACTFDVAKSVLTKGESTVLSWTTENATRVTIAPARWGVPSGPLALDGSATITPDESTVYTLTAENAAGDSVTCTEAVAVDLVVNPPSCTLSIAPERISVGGSATITWQTRHVTEFSIDNGVGNVRVLTQPIAQGTIPITPSVPGTYTYTGTAKDGSGNTVTCSDTIIVESVVPGVPACTLTADDLILSPGESTTLRWTIRNATEATLQHLDAVSIIQPVDGTQVTQAVGTYTLTVTDADGDSDVCQVTLTRPVVNAPQCVSFVANPNNINEGQSTTLTWDTENATSVSIDNGIGTVAADGSREVSPSGDTTYTLTATGNGQTVTCDVFVDVDSGGGGNPGPQCDLFTADPSTIRENQSTTLTWETTRADSVEIDNGIGSVADDGSIEVSPSGDTTYTLTARAGTRVDTCDVFVDVDSGGGGGSRRNPRISIDVLPPAPEGTFAVVSLSQIPYTGLELGPMGTVFYWTALILWSGALAYLVLFKVLPLIMRRGAVAMSTDTQEEEVARPQYRAEGGFASLKHEDNLSVDDIVRGLSNGTGASAAYVEDDVDEEYMAEEEATPVAPVAQRGISSDAAMFLNAVMAGDKTAAFGMLRRAGRSGSPEGLVEDALVLLDEAYRARIDGTECNQDVARICAPADNALLEQVIDALATAVDTSYSKAQTGAKMALTRALAIVQKS